MSRNAGSNETSFGAPLDTANDAERDAVYGFGRIGRAAAAPPVDAGASAAAASAAIDAFLAARVAPPDPGPVMVRIRDAAAELAALPFVAADGECRRLVGEMAAARDMDALHAVVEKLERHVAALLSGETRPVPAAPGPSRDGPGAAGRPRLLLKL
jgi:hypothetical protein